MKFTFIALIICTFLSTSGLSQVTIGTMSLNGVAATTEPDPNEVVRKAIQNTMARSFRAYIEMTGSAGGSTLKSDMEYVAPNRLRMTAEIAGAPGNGESLRFTAILIDKDCYVNMGGAWTKLATDFPDLPTIDKMVNVAGADQPKFKLIGSDTINGNPAVKYEDASFNHDGHSGVLTVWVGANDNFVYRIAAEIRGEFGDGIPMHMISMSYRDFNADIKIEPPL
jgi:hypothetical protein